MTHHDEDAIAVLLEHGGVYPPPPCSPDPTPFAVLLFKGHETSRLRVVACYSPDAVAAFMQSEEILETLFADGVVTPAGRQWLDTYRRRQPDEQC